MAKKLDQVKLTYLYKTFQKVFGNKVSMVKAEAYLTKVRKIERAAKQKGSKMIAAKTANELTVG